MVEALRGVFAEGFVVDSQLPLRLGKLDEPKPDVAVLDGSIRDFADFHPTTAVLIVEVADTSIRFDRKEKSELYAESGIEEYWIVNLKKRCIEVHRGPAPDENGNAYYSEIFVVAGSNSISPLARPKAKIKVASILP